MSELDEAKSEQSETSSPANKSAAGSEYVDLPPAEEPTFPNTSGSLSPVVEGAVRYRYFGMTDVGLVREHNEDNFLVTDLATGARGIDGDEILSGVVAPRGLVLAVCDGMGGAAAGEVASQMAVDTLYEVFEAGEPTLDREVFARRLVHAIEEAGSRIFTAAKMDRSRRGMGTTSTVAGLIDRVLFVGQVGDSRCYVLRNGKLGLITKDQSLVNQLIEAGQLTEEEAEAFEHSNIILQALGTTERVVVDLTFLELRRGDRVMLCSDGLSGLVHVEMIRDVLSTIPDPRDAAAKLVEYANNGGGHDNITCVIADFDGEGLLAAEDAPAAAYQQYPLPSLPGEELPPERDSFIKAPAAKPGADVKQTYSTSLPPPPSAPVFPWWILAVAGLLLLLLGLTAWFLAQPPEQTIAASAEVTQAVRVRTDDTSGNLMLYVDGAAVGPISASQPVSLPLRVGDHRFELRDSLDDVVTEATYEVRAGTEADFVLEVSAP